MMKKRVFGFKVYQSVGIVEIYPHQLEELIIKNEKNKKRIERVLKEVLNSLRNLSYNNPNKIKIKFKKINKKYLINYFLRNYNIWIEPNQTYYEIFNQILQKI